MKQMQGPRQTLCHVSRKTGMLLQILYTVVETMDVEYVYDMFICVLQQLL